MKRMPIFVIVILMAFSILGIMALSDETDAKATDPSASSILVLADEINDTAKNDDYSYERIDKYALNTPSSAETSIESLAAYLIAPARNDREKARSIFRWIAENIDYNVEGYYTGSFGNMESADVLRSRKSVCEGYSDLFQSLADASGLEAVRISGYGKGYSYQPGIGINEPSNHAWNAVKINGTWYLMDSTWGAGYINENKKFVREFDDHYFMTPPAQFIFDHLPENESWQLLTRPVSKTEFEQLIYVKSDFFKYGLAVSNYSDGVCKAKSDINISILAPKGVLLMADLNYAENNPSTDSLDNMVFRQRAGDKYYILAQFPVRGKYLLRVYAKQKDEPDIFHEAIEYLVDATAGSNANAGFPMIYSKFTESGAYLYSPMEGRLKSGVGQHFKILVPGAENVSVTCGENWSDLDLKGEIFEGNLTAEKGDVRVFARFEKESYDGLLGYTGY
ncbi:Transglutaminase-like superfamily protein [uncultured archaeon]|nr:Transglutaminase-like superfamily protein [uncultured archaeon]